ncbi:MAG: type II 3-dehydroquinate dehydratase [Clostridiales bacterium]|nr:type II 3-dehydroquinate dehydratase [Clostridiales bacterium]
MKTNGTIFVLNGPNLDMLGVREPQVYGAQTLQDVEKKVRKVAEDKGYGVQFLQFNGEGEMVDALHRAYKEAAAVVLNAGAYTHYSYAISDAVKMLACPVIELHISNIFARESFRRESVISPYASVVLCGAGTYGYELAVLAAVEKLQNG